MASTSKSKKESLYTPAPLPFAHAVGRVIVSATSALTKFRIGSHVASRESIAMVGELIQQNVIHVVFIKKGCRERDQGWVGSSESVWFLALKRPEGVPMLRYRALALHEAVHASWMLTGARYEIDSITDEAIAFVCEAMYQYKQGVLASEFASDPMLLAAHDVARHLRTQSSTQQALQELKKTIIKEGYPQKTNVYHPVK